MSQSPGSAQRGNPCLSSRSAWLPVSQRHHGLVYRKVLVRASGSKRGPNMGVQVNGNIKKHWPTDLSFFCSLNLDFFTDEPSSSLAGRRPSAEDPITNSAVPLSGTSIPVGETTSLCSGRCFRLPPTVSATREAEAVLREARNFSWKSRRSCSVSPARGRRCIVAHAHVEQRMRTLFAMNSYDVITIHVL